MVTTSFAIWQTLFHLSPEKFFYTVLPIWNFYQAMVTFKSSSSLTPTSQMVTLTSIRTWVSTLMGNIPTSAIPWAKMTNNSTTAKCKHHPTIKTTVLGKSSTCSSESTELPAQWIPLANHLTTSLPLATTPWLEACNRTRSLCHTLTSTLRWANSLRTRNPWVITNRSNLANPIASRRELARVLG